MASIKADRNVCKGFANCVMVAPKYFDLGDDGIVVVKQEHVDEGDLEQVEAAVNNCPVGALSLEDP